MRIIGADLGNGYVKMAGEGEASAIFPSVIGTAEERLFHNAVHNNGHGLSVEFGNQRLFVGELAIKQSSVARNPQGRERPEDFLRTLLLCGLFEIGVKRGEVGIVTGLPVNWYGDHAALAGMLSGPYEGRVNGTKVNITVEVLRVIPQHMGGFYQEVISANGLITDPHDLLDHVVSIVDVGAGTTGFNLVEEGEYISARTKKGMLDEGATRVYQLLQTLIEQHGIEYDLLETERAACRGYVEVFGQRKDIHDLVSEAARPVADKIADMAQSLWANAKTHKTILVSGGGAPLVFDHLRALFPQVQMLGQMANAVGFYRYGTIISEEH